jgi:hypothetical protein
MLILLTCLIGCVLAALGMLYAQGTEAATQHIETNRLLGHLIALETTKQQQRVPGSGLDQIRERLIIRAAAKAAKAKG